MILFIALKWVQWAFGINPSEAAIDMLAFFSFCEVLIEIGGSIAFGFAYLANKKG